jgi:hypothetical protein
MAGHTPPESTMTTSQPERRNGREESMLMGLS